MEDYGQLWKAPTNLWPDWNTLAITTNFSLPDK